MIATALIAHIVLASAPQAQAPARVWEYRDAGAKEIAFVAFAPIPKLSANEADALDALVDAIPRDVEGYSRRDALDTTNGAPIRCVAGPDYIKISFSVPPENWRAGVGLMEALVQRSRLTLPERPRVRSNVTAWDAALAPYRHAPSARLGDVQRLYRGLFRRENVILAVGGAIEPGQIEEEWQKRADQWPRVRNAGIGDFGPEPAALAANPGGLSSVELYGPSFGSADAALSTRTLALIALGAGKGASLFRVAREKLALSYRQEALLYPAREGWQPRLLLVTKSRADLPKKAEALRQGLMADVKEWSEADLQRAKGMADAIFLRGVDFSPFAFAQPGAFDTALESQTFFNAYWRWKTGLNWDPDAFLRQMKSVTLADLKETATSMLTAAKPRVLPAEG